MRGTGPPPGARRLVARTLPMVSSQAQPEEATWDPLPESSTPAGGANGKLALVKWNVTSLMGKEPELVCDVEKFQLDLVGLTSTHSKGSETSLLERGWILYHSGVANGARRWAGVAILVAPRLSACILEFTPVNERSVEGVLESAPSGGSLVLLGDFNAHIGSDSATWRDLRPLVLDTQVKRGAELSTDHHLVVSWLRCGKAPGLVEIRPEFLKALDVKGDWRLCSNYRGITLLSLPGKVYSEVLERRVRQIVELRIQEEQCGFRPGHGTVDQLYTLSRGVLWGSSESWGARPPIRALGNDQKKGPRVGGPREDPVYAGETMSLGWSGNALRFPQTSWKK
ncbi:hypothetical protein D4764_04G0009480 [Takifugu flavidus]|uniref:Endonuclease/exonuclease/phosphatase domain-containing protein n=1 Tax=Takifugu flavidus TaxID=433684 RepID=A0A5C6N7P2_9TELE|nr:hypothetical protein D4764_04G0009480 [Takifugu flavidus]